MAGSFSPFFFCSSAIYDLGFGVYGLGFQGKGYTVGHTFAEGVRLTNLWGELFRICYCLGDRREKTISRARKTANAVA